MRHNHTKIFFSENNRMFAKKYSEWMKSQSNYNLKHITTFGVDAVAQRFIEADSLEDLSFMFNAGLFGKEKVLVVGGGSNLLFRKDFDGTVVKPIMKGIAIVSRDENTVVVEAGAGEQWDDLVAFCVCHEFYGIENLSHIPGNVGACPVQNIGAYGVEVKDHIHHVEAFNMRSGSVEHFSKDQCKFAYRNSIFKQEYKDLYIVTRVQFTLSVRKTLCLDYKDIRERVTDAANVSLQQVRDIVIEVRKQKLPDPAKVGNAGSFFKNPIVSRDIARTLMEKYPGIVTYDMGDEEVKLAAGWLIDQAGWKGFRRGDAGVHDRQALVLVNHGKATGEEIWELAGEIIASVKGRFGVSIELEVNML